MVRSSENTSITKISPVTGTLNIADNAAAVPHPRSSERVFESKCSIREKFEPMAAPVDTAGPSRPAEPPKPTVTGEVMSDAYIERNFIIDFFREIAYSTFGMPCPICLRTT